MSCRLLNSAQDAQIVDPLELRLGDEAQTAERFPLPRRAMVILVFGVDCGTCKVLAGLLSDLQVEYAAEMDCIGICIQNGCGEKLLTFRDALGLHFPLASCRQHELCTALGIPRTTWLFYPTLIFLDVGHRLRGYFVGGSDFYTNTAENLRLAVSELLEPEQPLEWPEGSALEVEV